MVSAVHSQDTLAFCTSDFLKVRIFRNTRNFLMFLMFQMILLILLILIFLLLLILLTVTGLSSWLLRFFNSSQQHAAASAPCVPFAAAAPHPDLHTPHGTCALRLRLYEVGKVHRCLGVYVSCFGYNSIYVYRNSRTILIFLIIHSKQTNKVTTLV